MFEWLVNNQITSIIIALLLVGFFSLFIERKTFHTRDGIKKNLFIEKTLGNYYKAEPLEKYVSVLLHNHFSLFINAINLLLKNGEYTSQIDNLLITDKAIYCIECKDYKGSIGIYEFGKDWYQNLYKESYKIYNPIKQNESHINFLKRNILELKGLPFINLIVFSNEATLKNTEIKQENTHVINLEDLILYISSYERILKSKVSIKKLESIKERIRNLDNFSEENLRIHIENIITKHPDEHINNND